MRRAMRPVRQASHARGQVNVLVTSLVLFFLYLTVTVVAAVALAAGSMTLHPATRIFIWCVMSAAVGYGLLRRHGDYPAARTLALVLALAILMLVGLSIAAMLRLGAPSLPTQVGALVVNALTLFAAGAAGFSIARVVFRRRHPVR
jgi:hypothetical protein